MKKIIFLITIIALLKCAGNGLVDLEPNEEITNLEHTELKQPKSTNLEKKYSEEKCTLIDSRDGNKYGCVKVSGLTWMSENLRYLPAVTPGDQYPVETTSPYKPLAGYYVYNYTYDSKVSEEENLISALSAEGYNRYGVYYTHKAASDACPIDWHLPNAEEWQSLFLATQEETGKGEFIQSEFMSDGSLIKRVNPYEKGRWNGVEAALRSKDWLGYSEGSESHYPDFEAGSDLFGFNIIGGGMWRPGAKSTSAPGFMRYDNNYRAYFWTSDIVETGKYGGFSELAIGIRIEPVENYPNNDGAIWTLNMASYNGLAIRCVKD